MICRPNVLLFCFLDKNQLPPTSKHNYLDCRDDTRIACDCDLVVATVVLVGCCGTSTPTSHLLRRLASEWRPLLFCKHAKHSRTHARTDHLPKSAIRYQNENVNLLWTRTWIFCGLPCSGHVSPATSKSPANDDMGVRTGVRLGGTDGVWLHSFLQ